MLILRYSFAMAELYVFIASMLRRFELELCNTVRERDIDIVRDSFIGEASIESPGVYIKVIGAHG